MDAGTLYIIASPIGNLEDITLRALRVLRDHTDIVYCEDTRQTRKLLSHYNIDLPVRSLHAHSDEKKISEAVDLLLEGKSVSYLTDSGTPGVSDPGSRLVSGARDRNISILPVPGPSALTSIVSIGGFPSKNIHFGGFLSKKEGKKKRELVQLSRSGGIIVLYESPYRIKKTILTIHEVFPGADIIIGREMSKIHEEYISGPVSEVIKNLDSLVEKGEFTLAIHIREKDIAKNDPES